MSIYNDKEATSQAVYDSYNSLLFSRDRDVLFKMVTRIRLFEAVAHLNGDIVECGVFKGSGMMLWCKLLELFTPNTIGRVVGFDFFDETFVSSLPDSHDRKTMGQVFSRCDGLSPNDISEASIQAKLVNGGVHRNRFELVRGDVCTTSKEYVENKPGFRIILLYMDLDLEVPTYEALVHFWPRVVSGGIVVFDEYGYHAWTESNAVDRFVKENGLYLYNTGVRSPTAYIVKA